MKNENQTQLQPQSKPPPKTLSLFVFIDALGYEILKNHTFLDDTLKTKAPLGTIFGYSSTCDPTIITGKLPREHDHFSFFAYNPEKSIFKACRPLSFLPRALMHHEVFGVNNQGEAEQHPTPQNEEEVNK